LFRQFPRLEVIVEEVARPSNAKINGMTTKKISHVPAASTFGRRGFRTERPYLYW
jgi:hypothetical protein